MTTLPDISRTSSAKPKFATGLIYSVAKLGKTYTVHKTVRDPKLTLATEDGETQGLQSIQDLDVPYLEIRDWPTFELIHAELTRVRGKCQYKGMDIANIIVDSYSCCGNLWFEDALKKLGWPEIGLGRGRAALQPYSYVAEKGRQATKRLMMLTANHSCNVIVIAREGVYETGMGTDEYKSVPCIEMPGGKLHTELPGSFDFVVRMKIEGGKRVFVTQPQGGAIAGVRVPPSFGDIPQYVEPNVDALIRCVLGDKTALDELRIKKPAK